MDRRTFVVTASAAAIVGVGPVMATGETGIRLDMAKLQVPVVNSYAMLLQFTDQSATPFINIEALIIHPQGKITVAPDWTIERAMTEVWPQPGKWWKGELTDFFGISYRERVEPGSNLVAESNSPGPMPRDENLVAVINHDGSVEFGPQFDGGEPDRAAWREMGRVFVKLAAQ